MKVCYGESYMKPKILGYKGEALAAQYLKNKGFEILENNFTVRGGEIDIVARDGKTLVFVEVKTRTDDSFGGGEESVDGLKKYHIHRAIKRYLNKKVKNDDPDYRVDVVEINLDASGTFKNVQHFEDIELE